MQGERALADSVRECDGSALYGLVQLARCAGEGGGLAAPPLRRAGVMPGFDLLFSEGVLIQAGGRQEEPIRKPSSPSDVVVYNNPPFFMKFCLLNSSSFFCRVNS